MVTLNLKKEIKKSIVQVKKRAETKDVVITIDVDKDLKIVFTKSYLESILFNLLTNSIKYRSKDRKVLISIKAECINEEVKVTIADNGLGIDLEKYGDKIFGMYKTFHGNEDATGLGLFMVKNQIESMNGRIEVESKVGEGTTFNIYFV